MVWKRPVECLLADTYMRQILTSHLLKTHLGRFYVHPDLTSASAQLLSRLGLRRITSTDLLQVLKASLDNFRSDSALKWLLLVHHCLSMNQTQNNVQILSQLKKLSLIPVKNQTDFVNLESNNVFFPQKTKKSLNLLKLKIFDAERFFGNEDKFNTAKIVDLLKSLGMKELEPNEIINSHILPCLKEPQPDQELFVPFLAFLFNQWSLNQNFDLSEIKEFLRVKTNKGFRLLSSQEPVYLTPVYGNKYDLLTLLPSYDWCLLDPVYVLGQSKETVLNWKRFFHSLGVRDLFAPRLIKLHPNPDLIDKFKEKTKNREISSFLDYECDVFNYYTLNPDLGKVYEELGVLYGLIEANWESGFEESREAAVVYVGGEVETLGESSFDVALKTRPWICVGKGQVRRACEVFSKESVLLRYYGNRVPFTVHQPSTKSSFARHIGIKTEFNFIEFASHFKTWTQNPEVK